MHGKLAAAAKGVTVDGGDHRLGAVGDGLPQAVRAPQHHLDCTGVGHLRDIGAGGKSLIVAREHDAPHLGDIAQPPELFGEQTADRHVQGVLDLGPVDADKRHPFPRPLDEDFRHVLSL